MKSIRERVLKGEVVCGTWIVLGSSLAAEIAGNAGFDWVVLDMEHGMGHNDSLLFQLQALEGTPAVPIVRVAWNDAVLIKQVLDLGPAGVMVPYVNSADEARRAVQSMRYPPQGARGVSPYTRAAKFGQEFKDYYAAANERLLCITQIETAEAVANAEKIAAVDGVDVLFVGPLDLSIGLGVMLQFDHPSFCGALDRVAAACRNAGKVAGTLLVDPSAVEGTVDRGFTFVGLGSDGSGLASVMSHFMESFRRLRHIS
jgi:2-keto-3-deoxy-L-rhamnonate aldolase RhmA